MSDNKHIGEKQSPTSTPTPAATPPTPAATPPTPTPLTAPIPPTFDERLVSVIEKAFPPPEITRIQQSPIVEKVIHEQKEEK